MYERIKHNCHRGVNKNIYQKVNVPLNQKSNLATKTYTFSPKKGGEVPKPTRKGVIGFKFKSVSYLQRHINFFNGRKGLAISIFNSKKEN